MKTHRIGLIGYGRWGRNVLRDLVDCGAKVHVACRSTKNRDAAHAGGAESTGDHWSKLPNVDGYVVVTPSSTHGSIILELMATGKPIFVEKPMTTDIDSARAIAADDDGQVFVMDKWRYHKGVQAMRSQIAAGTIGKLQALKLQRWSAGHSYDDVTPFWILAPHDLAIVDYLLGELPALDHAYATVPNEPALGVLASLGRNGPVPVTLDIGVTSTGHERRITAIGDQGVIELLGGYSKELFLRRGAVIEAGQEIESIAFKSDMPLRTELMGFLAFLSGGPKPLCGAKKGCEIVERLDEIEKQYKLDRSRVSN